MGIVGLTLTLAKEGAKRNIKLNCIAPNAYTQMTEGILPGDYSKSITVQQITPVVTYLCHES